jgi:hypothetical protein
MDLDFGFDSGPEGFPVKSILAVVILLSALSFAQDSATKPHNRQPARGCGSGECSIPKSSTLD